MVDDNAALDMAAVSDAALPGEEAAVARLGEAIGHVEEFVEIPRLIVAAVAAGLSLAGVDEGLLALCLPRSISYG